MERITYRITLDAHKNGIQRMLQGFETGNNMSRRISINLVESGDTFEIPFDHVTAMMYVLPNGADEPSINACTIEDNTIIYDVLPTDIATEGITEMQVKIIEGRSDGARNVLVAPKFALEVTESNIDDEGAEKTTTFTALEDAVAKAESVYNERFVRIEITDDYKFRAYYADGSFYESNVFYEALNNGNTLLAESYAKGGTGVREGEDTDNSKYYSNVSRSASVGANLVANESKELLDEARLKTAFTAFNVNFETGNLDYASPNYTFDVNEETGDLEAESNGSYEPEQVIGDVVNEFLETKVKDATVQYELLWENPDPNVEFPETRVEIGADAVSKHNNFLITYKNHMSDTSDIYSHFFKKPHEYDGEFITGSTGGSYSRMLGFLSSGDTSLLYSRRVTMTDSEVSFSDCDSNSFVIPCKIYGVNQKVITDIDAQVASFLESTFIPKTQEEYDTLVETGTVDNSKYYMIVENNE